MISLHLILQILKIPLQKHKNSKCELNTPLSDTENFQRLLCSNRPMNPTAPGPCRIGFACFSSSPRFHLLPLLPQTPLSMLSTRAAPSSPPRSPAQLQLESSWCGSTLRTSDKGMPAYSLPFPSHPAARNQTPKSLT